MPTAATPRTRYITIGDAADHLSVTERTVRNFIARGELTGYRIGTRAIRVDLHEVEALLTPIPTANVGGAR